MAKRYDMAVKTGSYQIGSDTKNRYQHCGEIHSGDHGFYARVNPFVMLGLAQRAISSGEDSMLVTLFDVKRDDGGDGAPRNSPTPTPTRRAPPPAQDNFENYDPDIPF